MEDKISLNCRITLTTRNGSTFTGVLHYVDEANEKVILKNVTTAGSKLCGIQIFYKSDLISCQILDDLDGKEGHKKSVHNKNKCFDSDEKVSLEHTGEECENKGNNYRDDESSIESEDYYQGDDYVLICRRCEKFFDAIAYIMHQKVVGVTVEGQNIGRDGVLSLIQVSIETDVIIFDMMQLGEQAFDDGLRFLFEDINILKVIHDCRWISDMWYQQFNIRLVNIFDTQVANAFVHKIMNYGRWPQYVQSFSTCLDKHLHLSAEKISLIKLKGQSSKENYSSWLQRPLPDKLLLAAKETTLYLIPLYKVLNQKLLCEFRLGVDLYLNHVTNWKGDKNSVIKNGSLLPPNFQELPELVNLMYAEKNIELSTMGETKYCDSKRTNTTENPTSYNHGSIWKRAERSGMYQHRTTRGVTNYRTSTLNNDCKDKRISENKNINNNNFRTEKQDSTTSSANEENILTTPKNVTYPTMDVRNNIPKGVAVPCMNHNGMSACFTEEQDNANFSGKSFKHDTNMIRSTGYTYPSGNSKVMSAKPFSNSILQKSRMWRIIHGLEDCVTDQPSNELLPTAVLSDQHQVSITNETRKDLMAEDNEKTMIDVCQKLSGLCLPQVENTVSKRLSSQSVVCGDSFASPLQLGVSECLHSPSSNKPVLISSSFDTENPLMQHSPAHVNNKQRKNLGFSAVPAGFQDLHIVKKKNVRKPSNSLESSDTAVLPVSVEIEDLSCIPMQNSFKNKQTLLAMSSICCEDPPFDERSLTEDHYFDAECSLEPTKSQESCNNECVSLGTGIDSIQQFKIFQAVMKKTSPSSNIKSKLLPPKTSPLSNRLSPMKQVKD